MNNDSLIEKQSRRITRRARSLQAIHVFLLAAVPFTGLCSGFALVNQINGITLNLPLIFPIVLASFLAVSIAIYLVTRKSTLQCLIEAEKKADLKETLSTAYEYSQPNDNPFTPLLLKDASEKMLIINLEKLFTFRFRRVYLLVPVFLALTLFFSIINLDIVLWRETGPQFAVSEKKIVEWMSETVRLPRDDPDYVYTEPVAGEWDILENESVQRDLTEKELKQAIKDFQEAYKTWPEEVRRKIREKLARIDDSEKRTFLSDIIPSPPPEFPRETPNDYIVKNTVNEEDEKNAGKDTGHMLDNAKGPLESGREQTGTEESMADAMESREEEKGKSSEGSSLSAPYMTTNQEQAFEILKSEKEIDLSTVQNRSEEDIIRFIRGILPEGKNSGKDIEEFIKQTRLETTGAVNKENIPAVYRELIKRYFTRLGLFKEEGR